MIILKYYVVSDVHGFYTELIEALKEKGFFEDKEPHKLIVCGDIMDRGTEAVKMQEFMIDLLHKDELVFIRGNHEDLILELADALKTSNGSDWFFYNNYHHWSNGTVDTVMQLCDTFKGDDIFDKPHQLSQAILETPFVSQLIPQSINYYETEHYVFVHGWIPFHKTLDENYNEVYKKHQRWRNASKNYWDSARWHNGIKAAANGIILKNKTIVCGHFTTSYGHSVYNNNGSINGKDAVNTPYYNKGIIALDARTVKSGFVNCIVIED